MLQKSVKSGLIAAHTKLMFFFPLVLWSSESNLLECSESEYCKLIEHHFQTMTYVAVYIDEHCDKKNGKKYKKIPQLENFVLNDFISCYP